MNLLSTHADNNTLLVDFPSNSTSDTANENNEHQHPSTAPSSVSFSNTSDMMIFPREALDRSKIWYKSKDMNGTLYYAQEQWQQILIDLSHMMT